MEVSLESVELWLLSVGEDAKYLPSARPSGYRGWWPHYDYDYNEEIEDPIRYDPDNIERCHDAVVKAPLSEFERRVLWVRTRHGKLRSWRKVGKDMGKSHEFCRHQYETALDKLTKYLISIHFEIGS